jgi:hypothetical protein
MKYNVEFLKHLNLKDFDEITIQYDRQDEQLIKFLEDHAEQRVILCVKDVIDFAQGEEWRKLNAIHEKYPDYNFAVKFYQCRAFDSKENPLLMQSIENLTIPFFTGDCVTNFDELNYLLTLGVSDVYLTENICFDLARARALCDEHKTSIRAFPNVAQANVRSTPALKKFFIRPEDVEVYEKYIDVLEFWGPADRQVILLKIYKKGRWFGDLNEIILDLNLEFDSRRIIPPFAQMRTTCRRKCMAGEKCAICDHSFNISKHLEDKNIIIMNKKN